MRVIERIFASVLTVIVTIVLMVTVWPITILIAFFTADNPENKDRGPKT